MDGDVDNVCGSEMNGANCGILLKTAGADIVTLALTGKRSEYLLPATNGKTIGQEGCFGQCLGEKISLVLG